MLTILLPEDEIILETDFWLRIESKSGGLRSTEIAWRPMRLDRIGTKVRPFDVIRRVLTESEIRYHLRKEY